MNCLEYALRFWIKNPDYIILYNSDHCINVPKGTEVDGFLTLDKFGVQYFLSAFRDVMNPEAREMLYQYFANNYNVESAVHWGGLNLSIPITFQHKGIENPYSYKERTNKQ